ncbi:MAG: cysteine desulfurase [Bacilli bacterium]|nr:cysteine desulfurase [Bacilli bacterium]
MYDIKNIRSQFPMLNNKSMQGKPLVFLDNCSTTFKPQCVIDAIEKYYTDITSNSHRGDYDLCYNMDVQVEETRNTVAKFINCESKEVVFTSGTTDSLNLLASSYAEKLNKDDVILISEAEHASNVLAWFKAAELSGATIKYIPLNEEGRITVNNFRKVISNKVKVVSIAQIGNVLGYLADIKTITKIAHEYGAIMVVDAAQSAPHIAIDFKDLDCDFLAFSAHKMCGPTGIGVLVGKYDILNSLNPSRLGGGMNAKFFKDGEIQYLDAPTKFEAGTLNLASIIGFKAAIEFIQSIGLDNIHNHEIELRDYALSRLSNYENIIMYNKTADSGIITFNIKDVFAQDEATLLNSHGIAIRSGQHCAKLLNEFLKTPATCRMSIYLYTSKEDIDAFVEAIINGGDILDAFFND